MPLARVHAGGKSAKPLDAVNETIGDEKFQGAIDDRRLVSETGRREAVEELVGGHRAVELEQCLEHAATGRRETQSPIGDDGENRVECRAAALLMIMRPEGRGLGFA